MKESFEAPLRAAAIVVFVTGVLYLLLNPPSMSGLGGLLAILLGGALIATVTAWLVVLLTGEEMPEPEFRQLEKRSETLARMPPLQQPPDDFQLLVYEALSELPDEFQQVLEHVPVVISNDGHERRAYGLYHGATVARDDYANRILIYQDTLERDFGHDPELLRRQVQQTVWHEVAHHLGWDERGVRGLGL